MADALVKAEQMTDVVISLRSGADLRGRSLRDVVLQVAEVEVKDVLGSGERMVIRATPSAVGLLRSELRHLCHIFARGKGRVL
jgi:hypothetical protein